MTENNQAAKPTVVVVGGGYGGITVAKALDETSDVVLVEPKDAFMHNIAALRALVDPSWLPRIFLPYAGLLTNGRVVRDRAVVVDPHRVVTASGEEISADYVVLATGSRYPFPAKTDLVDTHHAQEQVRQTNRALTQADRVLLVGAGPVGIELAGEIREVWPEKSIVLLDVADEILGGPYMPELKAELRRQLVESRVELIMGSPLRQAPPTEPGELATFTVTTEAGTEVTADIWFRCYGVVPNSDYLGDGAGVRTPLGRVHRSRPHPPGGWADNRLRRRGHLHRRRQDGRLRPASGCHGGGQHQLPGPGTIRPGRLRVHGCRHRSAHRTHRRGGSVPRTGPDRRARDHFRGEGQGPDGRPVRRGLRTRDIDGPLTEHRQSTIGGGYRKRGHRDDYPGH